MKPDYTSIGVRLKAARNDQKMTQQELAQLLDVSVSYVKNVERGGKPSIEYLLVVADKCQVSLDWLLTGVQKNTNERPEIPQSTQKIEAVFDPDLKEMIDVLKELMESSDPDLRGWAKIQFRKAFGEQVATIAAEKKHHA